ncbi:MAG: type II toxin-antitoxin system Phd/YefM family antitoxin [Chloroflexi bacterium]|nr:type II toxin-antitoxin system Phd/YefM family antitoxin [Chloroflexota bacterium]
MAAQRMSAHEARARFSELIGQVYYTKEPVIVERKGKPFAVVISPEQFEALQQGTDQAWAAVDRLRERNRDKDPDDVVRDVTAEVEVVRQERYARGKNTDQGGR